MDFSYTAEDEAFRAELRDWLDANLPEFMAAGEIGDENNPDRRTMLRRQAWQRRLHEGRWAAINWPSRGVAARPRSRRTPSTPRRWPGPRRRASTTPTASGRSAP